jgi:hypothetical protein
VFAFHSRDASSKALCISYTTKDAQLDDAFAFSPAPPNAAQPSLDKRSGRADEPHHQRGNGSGLPLCISDRVETHLHAFPLAYNCARRLKTLKGETPYEFICQRWTIEPERFEINPHHHSGTKHPDCDLDRTPPFRPPIAARRVSKRRSSTSDTAHRCVRVTAKRCRRGPQAQEAPFVRSR